MHRKLKGFSEIYRDFRPCSCHFLKVAVEVAVDGCGFSVRFLRFPTRYQYCTSNSRAAYLWQNDLLSHDGLASFATLAFQSPIGSLLDDIPHMFSMIGVQCIHEIHVTMSPCPFEASPLSPVSPLSPLSRFQA